jgi:hypothetical protein
MYLATSTYSPDFPIAVGKDLIQFGAEVYPTKDEILAARGSK